MGGVPALLLVATVVILASGAIGHPIAWRVDPVTLPEAVALRDAGEMLRLIRHGVDPNARARVRAGLVGEEAALTPLEAAVASRHEEMVAAVLANGARIDPTGWKPIACYSKLQAFDVLEVLRKAAPTLPVPEDCDAVRYPW